MNYSYNSTSRRYGKTIVDKFYKQIVSLINLNEKQPQKIFISKYYKNLYFPYECVFIDGLDKDTVMIKF